MAAPIVVVNQGAQKSELSISTLLINVGHAKRAYPIWSNPELIQFESCEFQSRVIQIRIKMSHQSSRNLYEAFIHKFGIHCEHRQFNVSRKKLDVPDQQILPELAL